ncbi:hypothetical protein ACWGJ2_16555 [Streptomyces sp. NPDC054796]
MPVLPETNPEKSWICELFAYDPGAVGGKHSPLRRIPHRLEVRPHVYASLTPFQPREQSQLLHALAWEFTSRPGIPHPQE